MIGRWRIQIAWFLLANCPKSEFIVFTILQDKENMKVDTTIKKL